MTCFVWHCLIHGYEALLGGGGHYFPSVEACHFSLMHLPLRFITCPSKMKRRKKLLETLRPFFLTWSLHTRYFGNLFADNLCVHRAPSAIISSSSSWSIP
jgi:hypothetical protein